MIKILLLVIFSAIGLSAMAQQSIPQVYEQNAVLHGDTVEFQITLVNAFPFISGEVNGVKGKFMFDTGNMFPIDINDKLVKLPNKKTTGNGVVGSGQSFVVHTNDTIAEVKFANGLVCKNTVHVKSANYNFLKKNIPSRQITLVVYPVVQ